MYFEDVYLLSKCKNHIENMKKITSIVNRF